MIVSPTQYQTVAPGTPFVAPSAPGALVIDPAATQYQIMIAKTQHDTALQEHQAYVLLQRSVIAQVQAAIEDKYTNAIRNRITGQLPGDIRVLKNHLFNTYGKINENELQEKYDSTLKMSYNISDPINDIFNAVEDLCEIAELANDPYSERQQVKIGFLILNRQPIFHSDIRKWMGKPVLNKTWPAFITHFRQAHQELRDTDSTIDQLGFQSANAIVEQIVDRLRAEDSSMAPAYMVPTPPPGYESSHPLPPGYGPPYPPTPNPPTTATVLLTVLPQANAVLPVDPHTTAMQVMMQNMQLMHDSMHQSFQHGRGRGNRHGTGRGRGNRGRYGRGTNGRGAQAQRDRGGNYCHTHGNCAHSSSECRSPGENHQNKATFTNRMGGSTLRCYWINE